MNASEVVRREYRRKGAACWNVFPNRPSSCVDATWRTYVDSPDYETRELIVKPSHDWKQAVIEQLVITEAAYKPEHETDPTLAIRALIDYHVGVERDSKPSHSPAVVLPPVARDEAYDRDYIPLPGGWEIQTKGKGSTFRISDPQGNRVAVTDERLHGLLTRMARDIRAAWEARATSNSPAVAEPVAWRVCTGRGFQLGAWTNGPPLQSDYKDIKEMGWTIELAYSQPAAQEQKPYCWANDDFINHPGQMCEMRVVGAPGGSYNTPLYREAQPATQVPDVSFPVESKAFESWAIVQHYEMGMHPLHYLFLDRHTYSARQGWIAAIDWLKSIAGGGGA